MAPLSQELEPPPYPARFKVLSETFNYDNEEVAADPVHVMYVLEQALKREQFPEEVERSYLEFIKAELAPRYAEFIGNEIQKAYLESYTEYGQNLFDRYIAYADAWIEETDYKDPDTGQMFDREILDAELSKIEKPAGRTSATRSSSSRCGRGPGIRAAIRPGPATRSSATSSRSPCSARSRTCCR